MENHVGLGWAGGMVPEGFHTKESLPLSKQARTLVIGIVGKARHGKNTVAEEMVGAGVRLYGFADPLKVEVFDFLQAYDALCRENSPLTSHPISDRVSRFCLPCPLGCVDLSSEQKIAWVNLYKTPLRKLLQFWGTEYRRGQHPNYWVNKLSFQIQSEVPRIAVIPDVRFKNELSICDVTVLAKRLGYHEGDASIGAHVSETELDGEEFDYVIQADDGDVDGLKEKARKVFEDISNRYLVKEKSNDYPRTSI